MASILRKIGNADNVPVNIYEADTMSDMNAIDVSSAPIGSRCHVIDSGKRYALNSSGEWKEVPSGGSGGSGGGAVSSPENEVVMIDCYYDKDETKHDLAWAVSQGARMCQMNLQNENYHTGEPEELANFVPLIFKITEITNSSRKEISCVVFGWVKELGEVRTEKQYTLTLDLQTQGWSYCKSFDQEILHADCWSKQLQQFEDPSLEKVLDVQSLWEKGYNFIPFNRNPYTDVAYTLGCPEGFEEFYPFYFVITSGGSDMIGYYMHGYVVGCNQEVYKEDVGKTTIPNFQIYQFSYIAGFFTIQKEIYAKTVGSTIVLAHLTQNGTDDNGDPIFVSDKTFDELKAAYDRGDLLGVVPPEDWEPWEVFTWSNPETYIPCVLEGDMVLVFNIVSSLMGTEFPVDYGAYYIQTIGLLIGKNPDSGKTEVLINDAQLPDGINYSLGNVFSIPLPQQYMILLEKNENGTITSPTPFSEIVRCIMAYYRSSEGVFRDSKHGFVDMFALLADVSAFFKLSGYELDSSGESITKVIFTATTSRGLETITVSNDGTKDVWTHEVQPFAFFVHITSETVDGETVYKADKTYSEIVAAVQGGQLPFCNYPNESVYGPKKGRCIYTGCFNVPHGSESLFFETFGDWTNGDKYFKDCQVIIEDNNTILVREISREMLGAGEEYGGQPGYVPTPVAGDQNKFLRGDATWAEIAELPTVSASDNGKILQVVNGEWTAVELTNANGVNF